MALFINGKGPLDPARGGDLVSTMWHKGKKIYGRSKPIHDDKYGDLKVYNEETLEIDTYPIRIKADWDLLFNSPGVNGVLPFSFGDIGGGNVRGFEFNQDETAKANIPVDIPNIFLYNFPNFGKDLYNYGDEAITFPSWVKTIGGGFLYKSGNDTMEGTIDFNNIEHVFSLQGYDGSLFEYRNSSFKFIANKLIDVASYLFRSDYNKNNFNGEIYLDSLESVGKDFLSRCGKFNQPLNLPKLKTVGGNFLTDAYDFNNKNNIDNIEVVNGDFFTNAKKFNQPLNLPKLKTVNGNFLTNALVLNQPVSVPSLEIVTGMLLSGIGKGPIFNQDLNLPNLKKCDGLLWGAGEFNSNLSIGPNLTEIGDVLFNAYNLDHGSKLNFESHQCVFKDGIMDNDRFRDVPYIGTFEFKSGCIYNGVLFSNMGSDGDISFEINTPNIEFNEESFRRHWFVNEDGVFDVNPIYFHGPYAAEVAAKFPDMLESYVGRHIIVV